jgi:triphosphatase
MTRELELKLALTEDELRALGSWQAPERFQSGPPAVQTLRSIYFDTPDGRLRNLHLSLRVRQIGDHWVQTLKSETGLRKGVSHPEELEAEVAGPEVRIAAIPDRGMRKRLKALLGKRPLQPLFETVIERTVRDIKTKDGSTLELALDDGFVQCSDNKEALREVEIELKSGSPDALVDVASHLLNEVPFRPSSMNKAESAGIAWPA